MLEHMVLIEVSEPNCSRAECFHTLSIFILGLRSVLPGQASILVPEVAFIETLSRRAERGC